MKIFAAVGFVLLWVFSVILVVVWDQNLASILACALGVTAALLVIFRLRWWRAIGASASLLFVVNWALAFVRIGGGAPLDAYAAVIQSAAERNTFAGASVVLGYELILPLVHLAVGIALIVGLVRKRDR